MSAHPLRSYTVEEEAKPHAAAKSPITRRRRRPEFSASASRKPSEFGGATTAGSPCSSPSPPGSARIRARDTTKPPEGRPSETENPSRRCASSSAATPAADADAVGGRSNPRPAASGAESWPGTGGIGGSEARIWELGFRAPAGLRRLLASSREGRGEESRVETRMGKGIG